MRRTGNILLTLLPIAGLLLFGPESSVAELKKGDRKQAGQSLKKTSVISRPFWTPNRIGTYITNDGAFVDFHTTNNAGMEWPVGSGNTIHFAGGIWVGGFKNGEIVTAASEFSTEFQAGTVSNHGPGVAGTPANSQDSRFRVYVIKQEDTADPGKNPDYANWPAGDGAPVNEDGSPALIGTSTAWGVFNDFNETLHNNLFQTKPMGLEVQFTAWAFNRPDAFGDMIFLRYKFINKSGFDIDSTFVSLWNDIDVGDASDLVGCDTELSLGFNYKTQADGNYGDNPPAIGLDFFQGPIVPSDGDVANVSGREVPGFRNLPMTSFAKYINGGPPQFSDPENGPEAYSFMNGFDGLGDPLVNDLTGEITKFAHPGNPGTGEGWLDPTHGDKRFLMSSGPFTLAEGDTQEVVAGVIIAQGATGAQSVDLLKRNDAVAQLAYDINFRLPDSPPKPTVTVATEERAIMLAWEANAEAYEALDRVSRDPQGNETMYTFQGYNIYQLNSPTISSETIIRKIATYDAIDGVVDIRDDVFVGSLGQTVNLVVEEAKDTGVQRFIRITTDAVRGGAPLIQNRPYYYAVTAFGYNQYGIPKTLESSLEPMTIRPQSPRLGTKLTSSAGDTLPVVHTGPGDGMAVPMIVNPGDMQSASYEVKFRANDDGDIVWDVMSGGTAKVSGWTNQGSAGTNNFPIVDGVLVKVFGPPVAINNVNRSVTVEEGGPGGDRWISGTNWGGAEFFGGMDLGANFFGSTITPADYVTVDWRFTSNPTMSEENGWSRAYVYRRDLGYAVQGELGWIPIQMFDMTDPANPRQLNICFVEDANDGLADLLWNPIEAGEVGGAPGGREYLFSMRSSYDPDGDVYNDVNWGPAADVLYALWPNARSRPYLLADFWMRITPNFVNTDRDTYSFQTAGAIRDDAALAAQQAQELINVFPNPYRGFNVDEKDPVNRFVTFTHLPETGTQLKIFTLAGELIRTLDHNNGTQFERWDLRNQFGIPVASGMYIVLVDMGSLGQKTLKIGILQPEERLDVF